jgi:hypothetical protein
VLKVGESSRPDSSLETTRPKYWTKVHLDGDPCVSHHILSDRLGINRLDAELEIGF